ncbi:MAG: DUF3060 domain-containing protein [Mycobacterium sp.]
MNPEDPEQYIRDLERGPGKAMGATPRAPGGTSWPRFRGIATLTTTPQRRLLLGLGIAGAMALTLFLSHYSSKTTVDGNLIMINSGAKDTIACNNGDLKLDGDNNTYAVTGHCRRLEVFGSANHVTVDSADVISALGDDNAIVYHSGSPTINKTGNNNTVAQSRAPVE